jgi:hypothetical protein
VEYLSVGCRVLVGLVFAAAALGKARDVAGFEPSIRRLVPPLDALPRAWSRLTARLVIGLELVSAVLLVPPATAPWGFALALALDAAFTVAIGLVLRRGTGAACRCFGSEPRRLGYRHVVRDLMLGTVAALGLFAAVAGSAGGVAGRLVAAGAGAAGALLNVYFDDIVDLFVPGPLDRPSLDKESPWRFSRPR